MRQLLQLSAPGLRSAATSGEQRIINMNVVLCKFITHTHTQQTLWPGFVVSHGSTQNVRGPPELGTPLKLNNNNRHEHDEC